MTSRHSDILLTMSILFLLPLAPAFVLFYFLESSAVVRGDWLGAVDGAWVELGGPVGAFVVLLWVLQRWHGRLNRAWENQLSLAGMIAQMAAGNVVRWAEGDRNALNTAFSDMHENLQDRFRAQDTKWRNALARELRREVALQAREQFPELRDWQPLEVDSSSF